MKYEDLTAQGKRALWSVAVCFLLLVVYSFWPQRPDTPEEKLREHLENRMSLATALGPHLDRMSFPDQLNFSFGERNEANYFVEYTLDNQLQYEANKLLKRYKPDYGALFMMDAQTGEVLVYASFQRDSEGPVNLVKKSTYPAASVFKIVTASAAIDRAGISPSHPIRFNGGNWTLYKRNVMRDRINRWTRTVTLKDAFAQSMNTAFGKLSLKQLAPKDLEDYAERFLFNQYIPADFYAQPGQASVPKAKNYHLTEVASGYNRQTQMGPVQGAMIAASIINEGQMVVPYLVQSLYSETGEQVYHGELVTRGEVIGADSAKKIQKLMRATVYKGTSRKSFRPLVRSKKFKHLKVGGKTGHLRGNEPKGRVDWFVGYGSDGDRKIAVSAVLVNKKYWRVKSSYLSQRLIRKFFKDRSISVSSNP